MFDFASLLVGVLQALLQGSVLGPIKLCFYCFHFVLPLNTIQLAIPSIHFKCVLAVSLIMITLVVFVSLFICICLTSEGLGTF